MEKGGKLYIYIYIYKRNEFYGYCTRRHVGYGTVAGCAGGTGNVHGESFLLPLPGLVVLEPIEDILAFDLAVLAECGGDLLDLIGGRGSDPHVVVEVPQYPYLISSGDPPCAGLPAEEATLTPSNTTTNNTACIAFLMLLLLVLVVFHDTKN